MSDPSTSSSTAVISVHDLNEPTRAGQLFRRVLENNPQARAIIKQNPERALAALSQGDASLGLTPKGGADALESIVAEVGDDTRMKEMLGQHLTPERVCELLAARGDLDAALADLAQKEDLLAAIANDIASIQEGREFEDDGSSNFSIGLVLRGWALKIRDRADYAEVLQVDIAKRPLLHWIILAVWNEILVITSGEQEESDSGDDEISWEAAAGRERAATTEEPEQEAGLRLFREIGAAMLDELRIDPDEGVQLCEELVANGTLGRMRLNDLVTARRAVAERRERLEETPTALEEAREAVDGLVDALNI